ncbi:hypothetical protein A4G99_24040 [Haladaptatus sp. R4]|nr:hypothetical protein A4G99_24040 [Haladaptatus sp. R4]
MRSDWGHFRRIDRTVTKQTYRLPPRTTIAGMLAAIAGVNRDGYYDIFAPDVSAMAITPVGEIRTVTMPTLGLGTHPGETMADMGGTGQKTVKVKYPDSTDNRQIHSYELLVNPAFRLDVAVEDEQFYSVLKHRLETGTSFYPPSMGLSEYLAWIEDPREIEQIERVDSTESVTVDSVIPDGADEIVPQDGVSFDVERTPAFMEADERGRKTTGYADYAFSDRKKLKLRPNETTPVEVDGRTVVFH